MAWAPQLAPQPSSALPLAQGHILSALPLLPVPSSGHLGARVLGSVLSQLLPCRHFGFARCMALAARSLRLAPMDGG
eukprot:scaffold11360_cov114-Isochrysis_galbana.AAC.6